LPALTLHEAVPGHHLQIALARELDDIPQFPLELLSARVRRRLGSLHRESSERQMGVYHTPVSALRAARYEMWRACRLVIDTGIHAMEWTREQALDYLASNSAAIEARGPH
jgi:uncharacterized protein (DUF885 family)